MTNQIFGEHKYFQQKEDTTQDQGMQNYVEEDWESGVFVKKKGAGARPRNLTEKKGHTGNVVPFFPTDWKKNANDVFNLIMNG